MQFHCTRDNSPQQQPARGQRHLGLRQAGQHPPIRIGDRNSGDAQIQRPVNAATETFPDEGRSTNGNLGRPLIGIDRRLNPPCRPIQLKRPLGQAPAKDAQANDGQNDQQQRDLGQNLDEAHGMPGPGPNGLTRTLQHGQPAPP